METFLNIIFIFLSYPFSLSFLGSFFLGEEIILALSYLSAQNFVPFWTIFTAAYLGTISSNIAWFFIAKTRAADKILNLKYFSKGYKKIVYIFEESIKYNIFLSLLILRFAYGSRIITIFYLSREKFSLKKYIFYDFIISLIWLMAITSIGWFAGKGAERLVEQLRDFQAGLLILILIIIIVYFSKIKIKKLINKKHG
jgi:membrane protein DedA with SNARE-associated domain